MTKKDYIAIASAIHQGYLNAQSDDERRGIVEVVAQLRHIFYADNARFNSDRFRKACFEGLVSAKEGTVLRKAF
jgi:hypothetical protein